MKNERHLLTSAIERWSGLIVARLGDASPRSATAIASSRIVSQLSRRNAVQAKSRVSRTGSFETSEDEAISRSNTPRRCLPSLMMSGRLVSAFISAPGAGAPEMTLRSGTISGSVRLPAPVPPDFGRNPLLLLIVVPVVIVVLSKGRLARHRCARPTPGRNDGAGGRDRGDDARLTAG